MTDPTERERRKINELAREYLGKGYDVIVRPTSADLPGFLQGYQPDLIASSDTENAVVEVKTSETIRGSSYLIELAELASSQENWRLELVMTNPRATFRTDIEAELLSKQEVLDRLLTAGKLESEGLYDSSILVMWSAIEAILRRTAIAQGVSLGSIDSRALVKRLYSLGIIGKAVWSKLDNAAGHRNSIVRGYRPEPISKEFCKEIATIANELAEQMNG